MLGEGGKGARVAMRRGIIGCLVRVDPRGGPPDFTSAAESLLHRCLGALSRAGAKGRLRRGFWGVFAVRRDAPIAFGELRAMHERVAATTAAILLSRSRAQNVSLPEMSQISVTPRIETRWGRRKIRYLQLFDKRCRTMPSAFSSVRAGFWWRSRLSRNHGKYRI